MPGNKTCHVPIQNKTRSKQRTSALTILEDNKNINILSLKFHLTSLCDQPSFYQIRQFPQVVLGCSFWMVKYSRCCYHKHKLSNVDWLGIGNATLFLSTDNNTLTFCGYFGHTLSFSIGCTRVVALRVVLHHSTTLACFMLIYVLSHPFMTSLSVSLNLLFCSRTNFYWLGTVATFNRVM